jgi:hypothetical protein
MIVAGVFAEGFVVNFGVLGRIFGVSINLYIISPDGKADPALINRYEARLFLSTRAAAGIIESHMCLPVLPGQ